MQNREDMQPIERIRDLEKRVSLIESLIPPEVVQPLQPHEAETEQKNQGE